MAIFRFFQDGGRRQLGFAKFQIFKGRTAQEVEVRRLSKCGQNRSNLGQNMAIFRFFKTAADAILSF